eukprot:scaffold4511_cov171-Amphora_coffeaeformis.AAC.26
MDTNAYHAILLRVAWELSGRKGGTFRNFRRMYKDNDFGAADEWLTNTENRVMLLIDELNVLPPTWQGYADKSQLLDDLVQQKGCAVLYSTHQRSTEDLLRGRSPAGPRAMPSLWCSVIRGRMPALAVQQDEIADCGKTVMQERELMSEEERRIQLVPFCCYHRQDQPPSKRAQSL